jgi:GNAT superfamily N-acetyltransferase
LKTFLAQGCRGFLAEVDGRLAGWALIQSTGTYPSGYGGRFQIPADMMVLKNLLVFPEFRGHSLGKKLNQTRIAAVPEGGTPVAFVIAENRIAIRNLKMFGFEEMLTVTRTTWFRRWTAQRVRVSCDCDISRRLIRGLEPAEQSEEAG